MGVLDALLQVINNSRFLSQQKHNIFFPMIQEDIIKDALEIQEQFTTNSDME